MNSSSYDLVISGCGAAGLSAGLQAGRLGLKTVMVEKEMIGGWLVNADLIEDYPGFPDGVHGINLGMSMSDQAEKLGVEMQLTEVTGVRRRGNGFVVETFDGPVSARAVVVASGASHGRLGIAREEELEGSGISYCATCDGALFRNQTVAVVGGDDEALREALYLAQPAAKVVIVHAKPQLDACHLLRQRVAGNPKIEVRLGATVEAILGDTQVGGLQLRQAGTSASSQLAVAGVFVAVGSRPNTEFLAGLLSLSPDGKVPANAALETAVAGLLVAGMAREGHVGHPAVAIGEGIVAAESAKRFIDGKGGV
ncbi:MAG: FAD-dependent oxidoreductase [Chloroflexi bacterium]|nr:FAD-dependent oxidoreductase [Chloroflexota bacterium]